MIRGVANIWMPVQNIDRALDFYENILGLPVVKKDGSWADIDANGVMVGLNGREPEGAGSEGGPVLTFQTEGSLPVWHPHEGVFKVVGPWRQSHSFSIGQLLCAKRQVFAINE
jgi:catechol 2,3-dioxygenase-like lactoylglutathione lyase family enzyme